MFPLGEENYAREEEDPQFLAISRSSAHQAGKSALNVRGFFIKSFTEASLNFHQQWPVLRSGGEREKLSRNFEEVGECGSALPCLARERPLHET